VLAIALIGFGAVLLWAAFTGRGAAVIDALKMDLPNAGTTSPGGAASGGGSGGKTGDNTGVDSGTHQGMTDTGDVYTIAKTYADMTDQEKHDANNFAHNTGG
jgi:hypothetical protein